ncbi:methyltransferase domain-containing protein [Daedaleopsis nitida]|nr:methyltransferase domain-containing protein [Daedaleopsis nitida]
MQLILDLLDQPLIRTLFETHPNHLGTSSFELPEEWSSWWDWAGSSSAETPSVDSDRDSQKCEAPWIRLLRHSSRSGQSSVAGQDIPLDLRSLIEDANRRVIPRNIGQTLPHVEHQPYSNSARSVSDPATCPQHSSGMSPKKSHEVVEMSSFIRHFLLSTKHSSTIDMKHVVDIGAGQAYLSRALRDQLGLHVLALDWSDVQTRGAARKDAAKTGSRSKRAGTGNAQRSHPLEETEHSEVVSVAGSLTYVTTTIDQASLLSSTSTWISGSEATDSENSNNGHPPPVTDAPATPSPTPVLFVALHACGSLTPDILRAFVAARKACALTAPWTPQGAVVVGCCYNMLRPEDFPLSRAFRSCRNAAGFALTANHLQLAAQVPSQWLRSEESRREATLALRKIVWRALLEDPLREQVENEHVRSGDDDGDAVKRASGVSDAGGRARTEEQADRRPRRLGRLRDSAYADWETFVGIVRAKLGNERLDIPRGDAVLERGIEVFHTLRCLAGPVVESLILLDRLAWMQEELEELPFDAKLVNLFDQASGSGRNVAIVITPSKDARA